jgi:hypothetical protein
VSETKRMSEVSLERSGPRPEQFPIGSLESRAAARALLETNRPAPHIFIVFYRPSENGPVKIDAHHARIDGGQLPPIELVRDLGETLQEFESRVADSLPVRGLPRGVVFYNPDDEPPAS